MILKLKSKLLFKNIRIVVQTIKNCTVHALWSKNERLVHKSLKSNGDSKVKLNQLIDGTFPRHFLKKSKQRHTTRNSEKEIQNCL